MAAPHREVGRGLCCWPGRVWRIRRSLPGSGCRRRWLLLTIGQNAGRLRNEAAFAPLRGQPDPSGRPRGQERAASAQPRRRPPSQPHPAHDHRRSAQVLPTNPGLLATSHRRGQSKREAMRCLKRYLARELYRTLTADLKACRKPLTSIETSRHLTGCSTPGQAAQDNASLSCSTVSSVVRCQLNSAARARAARLTCSA